MRQVACRCMYIIRMIAGISSVLEVRDSFSIILDVKIVVGDSLDDQIGGAFVGKILSYIQQFAPMLIPLVCKKHRGLGPLLLLSDLTAAPKYGVLVLVSFRFLEVGLPQEFSSEKQPDNYRPVKRCSLRRTDRPNNQESKSLISKGGGGRNDDNESDTDDDKSNTDDDK